MKYYHNLPQATSFFLDAPSVATYVVESHAAASLIAATIHDLDHPGRFIINEGAVSSVIVISRRLEWRENMWNEETDFWR